MSKTKPRPLTEAERERRLFIIDQLRSMLTELENCPLELWQDGFIPTVDLMLAGQTTGEQIGLIVGAAEDPHEGVHDETILAMARRIQ